MGVDWGERFTSDVAQLASDPWSESCNCKIWCIVWPRLRRLLLPKTHLALGEAANSYAWFSNP